MLDSAPSFSIYNPPDGFEDLGEKGSEGLERSVTIGDNIDALSNGDFSFVKNGMGLIKEEEEEEKDEEEEEEGLKGIQKLGIKDEREPASPPMYLATGLGINAVTGFGSGIDFSAPSEGECSDVEEHYKRMVEEYPCHPLFLRNYAQLLQSKGDLAGAEQYYHRATLAEPGDGEVLMLYANLVWELHHDKEKALYYFERSAEAAPHDSHVLAAYARFLWETEDDEEEDGGQQDHIQWEGGPQGNEECYLQTMQTNPGDGAIMTQYAKMAWELHHDRHKASSYFERAVEASPEDSHVLAAYASFLWEAEDEEDDIGAPLFHGITAPANAGHHNMQC